MLKYHYNGAYVSRHPASKPGGIDYYASQLLDSLVQQCCDSSLRAVRRFFCPLASFFLIDIVFAAETHRVRVSRSGRNNCKAGMRLAINDDSTLTKNFKAMIFAIERLSKYGEIVRSVKAMVCLPNRPV
jgi:hypothetical protein